MSREQQLRRPPGLRPRRGEWRELPTDHAQRLVDGPIDFDEEAIRPGQSLPQMLGLLRSGDLPPDCRAVLGSVVVRVWDPNGWPSTRLWQLLRAWLVTPSKWEREVARLHSARLGPKSQRRVDHSDPCAAEVDRWCRERGLELSDGRRYGTPLAALVSFSDVGQRAVLKALATNGHLPHRYPVAYLPGCIPPIQSPTLDDELRLGQLRRLVMSSVSASGWSSDQLGKRLALACSLYPQSVG